jgi:hypothetical protein
MLRIYIALENLYRLTLYSLLNNRVTGENLSTTKEYSFDLEIKHPRH